jgi:hypothetical protein
MHLFKRNKSLHNGRVDKIILLPEKLTYFHTHFFPGYASLTPHPPLTRSPFPSRGRLFNILSPCHSIKNKYISIKINIVAP